MSEHWVDFTPVPPKVPQTIPTGRYFAKIVSVEEKLSRSGIRYWRWAFQVEGVHPDFRLYYATHIKDRDVRLQSLVKAVTGKKPKSKILIDPKNYISVRVELIVRTRIVALTIVNEIVQITHVK